MHPDIIEINPRTYIKYRIIQSVQIVAMKGSWPGITSYTDTSIWIGIPFPYQTRYAIKESGWASRVIWKSPPDVPVGGYYADPNNYYKWIKTETIQYDFTDLWDFITASYPDYIPIMWGDIGTLKDFNGPYDFGIAGAIPTVIKDNHYMIDLGAGYFYGNDLLDQKMTDSYRGNLPSIISFLSSGAGTSYEDASYIGGVLKNWKGYKTPVPYPYRIYLIKIGDPFEGVEKTRDEDAKPKETNPYDTEDVISPDTIGVDTLGNQSTIVSSYSGTPDFEGWSDITNFDSIYIPATVDLSDQSGIVVGYQVLAGEGALLNNGVYIESIKESLKESDSMTFVQSTKYDDTPLFHIGEKVFGLVYGQTKFLGRIRSMNRVLRSDGQFIRYEAVGSRGWLNELPFATEYAWENIGIRDAFETVVKAIASNIVADYDISELPNSIIPELNLTATSLGRALETIINYAGHFGFYIDHTKKLVVYDLEDLTTKDIYVATEGQKLSDHPEYKVMAHNMNIDTSQCKTRCIIQGDYPSKEIEQTVGPYKTEEEHPTPYTTVTYAYFQLHPNIQSSLLSDDTKQLTVIRSPKDGFFSGIRYEVDAAHIDYKAGIVIIKEQAAEYYNWHFRYVYKETTPLKVDTGWVGTAYTQYKVQQVITLNDIRFKKEHGVDVDVRDDTQKMTDYANLLLLGRKDIKYGGTVTLDGLQKDFEIKHCVNFKNTTEDWSNVKLAIIGITYSLQDKTTTLELTNAYYMDTGIIDLRLEDKRDKREQSRKDDYTTYLLKKLKEQQGGS